MTSGLFQGKLPVNHPLVQMMINDKIARLELEEAKEYWANKPKRKAYFFEKMANLISRTLHHVRMRLNDKKNSTHKDNLLQLQKELLILTNAMPHWTTEYLDSNVLRELLKEY